MRVTISQRFVNTLTEFKNMTGKKKDKITLVGEENSVVEIKLFFGDGIPQEYYDKIEKFKKECKLKEIK